ncbi:aspartate carbamoyltransferase regulatory subunit [Archaeoglobus veneficus]|uniref:Aspartate carbamoyltransferase regulatory chain n=1 Tax=Archaeoglobus veneficus (strain DSM 11195 / SNP6) TaxID=693661 RepID=F2KTB6_ARCVS|nr:aspartate carbamoyltransferase regulatory subunit [Archaeoglobus veneficus]AEA47146.1 Aspartate carbamoyltransferase regulatory chain [Archaeoglobus veneficus SNP6]
MSEQLAVSKIRDGTVIDHINAGKALLVLRILGIGSGSRERVLMAMNVPSRKMGKKDIVKVEGKFISEEELNRIALIAPGATINLIRDYEIYKKFNVSLPEVVEGILTCPNRNCITNSREPIVRRFHVSMAEDNVVARCHYCGRKITEVDKFVL